MDFSAIKDLENRFGLKAVKQNLCFVRGEGNMLFDTNDRPYLDLVCARGESCLGYANPALTKAITAQTSKLLNLSAKYYSEKRGPVLAKLLSNTGFTKACVTASASEAILTALDMTLAHLKESGNSRTKVVVASGEERFAHGEHIAGGISGTFVEFNNFEALKKALTPDTAVFVIAPVTESGIKIADYDYLVNAYALCKSMDIILFCDETRIGIGRTGSRFAHEAYGVQPDIVCLSRSLAAGLPIGAVLTRDSIAAGHKQNRRFDSGNLLSLAAAEVVLDKIEGGLLAEIAEKGEYLLSRLYKLTKYNFVLDVRGKGLLAGVELSGRIMAAKVVSQMEKMGYLLGYTEGNILRLSPSYTITHEQIDQTIDALNELFASTNI